MSQKFTYITATPSDSGASPQFFRGRGGIFSACGVFVDD